MTSKSASLSYEDLYPYQHRMIEHIREHDSCALWVDMGLGKTVATLTALQHLVEDFESESVLVVAPKRVAAKVWTDEIQTWAHLNGLTTSKIIGSGAKQRLAGAKRRADIHLINRENFMWLHDFFLEEAGDYKWRRKTKWPWDTVVIDESTSFKSQDSGRYQAMNRLRKYISRMIQLTGTPAPKGLQDLWGQAYLLDRGQRLGNTVGAFRQRWMEPPGYNQHKWTLKPSAEAQIHGLMGDIALTLRAEDYLDLPPVMFNWIRVEMTAAEKKKYEHFARTAIMELAGKRVTAVNAGVLWGKLLQLANGAVYTKHPVWEPFHDQKLEALEQIHMDAPDKMMIVYNYVSDLARIQKMLDKSKRNLNWRLLKSEKDEDDWNDGKIDRLLLHPASAGHGTNLHKSGCEEIVWYGLTANTEFYLQTNARLAGGHRRVGKNIRIHHIVCDDSQDDDARWILEDDTGQQDRLMEATKRIIREYG